VTNFLDVADGISAALAADDLASFRREAQRLRAVVPPLARELGEDHVWHAMLAGITNHPLDPQSADLEAARKLFLPFSTATVELVQRVRTGEPTFRSLKVYHCPMAPKPGLWFQAQGPLRNPYYGAKMLTCGEEVRPPSPSTTPAPRLSGQAQNPAPPARPVPREAVRDHNNRNPEAMDRMTQVMAARLADRQRAEATQTGLGDTNALRSGPLTVSQHAAVEAFMKVAADVSQALAADDLTQFNQQAARLTTTLPPLQKALAAPHPWEGLVRRLAGVSQAEPAKDLNEARKRFLPFSTTTVELARQLRKQDAAFASLKIYHCPMAPKPGLWIQAKGPLANPFYGAKMLTCGEEVRE
jgi:hypothetical protein